MPKGRLIPNGNPINEITNIIEGRYLNNIIQEEPMSEELNNLADEEVARATERGLILDEPEVDVSSVIFEDNDDQTFEELGSSSDLVGGRSPSPLNSPLTISRSKTPEIREKKRNTENFVLKIKEYIHSIEMKNIIEEAFDIFTERKENETSRR